jgi:hypothetical protein
VAGVERHGLALIQGVAADRAVAGDQEVAMPMQRSSRRPLPVKNDLLDL